MTLVIVGLHVALNWDWILTAVRRWRARPHPISHRSLRERLDLDGVGRVLGRFARLVMATAAVCVVAFLLVAALARAKAEPTGQARWKAPDFEEIPGEVSVQLLIVGVSAVVGRRVFRIRL